MRITDLELHHINIPFVEPLHWARGVRYGANRLIVVLRTDEGIEGFGEVHYFDFAEQIIRRNIAPLLIGVKPHDIERMFRKLEGVFISYQRAMAEAWAPVEMAMWDIIGKAAGQPVCNLLGGEYRKRIGQAPYVYVKSPAEMAEAAREHVAQGFKTVSLKIGTGPEEDLEIVAAVREAVGPNVRIRVDPNQAWMPGTARRLLAAMERYDLEYVQQPIRENDVDGMADLRHAVRVPITADESAFTPYDVMRLIKARAVDCVMIDPRKAGGIWQAKKAAAIAEAAGVPISFHNGSELGVALAAILHVAASTPNALYDMDTHTLLLSDDIIAEPLRFEAGALRAPDRPGLGVELDYDKLKRYAVQEGSADTFDPARPDWIPESPQY